MGIGAGGAELAADCFAAASALAADALARAATGLGEAAPRTARVACVPIAGMGTGVDVVESSSDDVGGTGAGGGAAEFTESRSDDGDGGAVGRDIVRRTRTGRARRLALREKCRVSQTRCAARALASAREQQQSTEVFVLFVGLSRNKTTDVVVTNKRTFF